MKGQIRILSLQNADLQHFESKVLWLVSNLLRALGIVPEPYKDFPDPQPALLQKRLFLRGKLFDNYMTFYSRIFKSEPVFLIHFVRT